MTNPRTDHAEADILDGDFFVANPDRLHLLRPALPGEVDAVHRALGAELDKTLGSDRADWMIVRRDGDEITRTWWPIPRAESDEMLAVRDEVAADEGFAFIAYQSIKDGRTYDPLQWVAHPGVQ